MELEHRWYLCEVSEVEEEDMPDFSRVPAERRQMVEDRWRARLAEQKPVQWKMWGPQIDGYRRVPGVHSVVVLGPA